jgi:hypothetical protein
VSVNRSVFGQVGFGLAVGVLAMATSISPAQAATAGWRAFDVVPVGQNVAELTSIAVVSAGDAWAAGDAFNNVGTGPGVIEHWTGRAWNGVKLPRRVAASWNANGGGLAQDVIGASSASNVWVFDGGGGFVHLSRHGWSYGMVPGTADLGVRMVTVTAVEVFSPTDVWIFGCASSGIRYRQNVPYADHFNGAKWARADFPGHGGIAAVSALSARDIWAVAGPTPGSLGTGTPRVLRWNGSRWRAVGVQPVALPTGAGWTTIYARSDRDVWVAGGGRSPLPLGGNIGATPERVEHWTGKRWLVTALPARASAEDMFSMVSFAADGSGLWGLDTIVITPNGGGPTPLVGPCTLIWHFTGARWAGPTVLNDRGACMYQLAGVMGSRSTWAVGTSGDDDLAIALSGPVPR